LRIHAGDLTIDGFTVEYDGDSAQRPDVDVPDAIVEAGIGYVDEAVRQARDAAGVADVGFEVTVDSEIPLGAGIGSSAAVVVAAIDAAARELGVELPRAELADRAYRVEHTVQDGQASRADTFASAMGGAVRVEGDDCRTLAVPSLPFVVGFDGGAGDTGALVSGVRSLRDRYGFAADTIAAIGDVVREGERVLADADPDEPVDEATLSALGRLMDFDHGLLSALGVSARSLDAMVWAARGAGARGAKLTGAGGGGCVVALDPDGDVEAALGYTPECREAFRAELATEGVRRIA
jgi:mevalonate kinase